MGYMRNIFGRRLDAFDPLRDLGPSAQVLGWWDFSELTGVADGASLFRQSDKSGFGHDLAQGTSANRPIKQTASDSRPVARFAGTHYLNANIGNGFPIGTAGVAPPVTFAVLVKANSTQASSFPIIMGDPNATAGSAGARLLIDAGGSRTAYLTGATSNVGQIGPTLMDDAWHSIVVTQDVGSGSMWVDGYLVATNSSSLGTNTLKSCCVGGISTFGFSGDVRLAMVIAGRLRAEQVGKLSTWLASQAPVPTPGVADAGVSFEDTTDAGGQGVRIFTPRTPSTPKTLLLWSHPAAANHQVGPNYWAYGLPYTANSMGWYFAASNMHADSWGNATAQADLQALYTLLATRDTFAKVVLIGTSMGGLATANVLAGGASIPNLVGGYFIDAVLSLRAQYAHPSYTAGIATAYGLASGTLAAASSSGATSISSSVSFPSGTSIMIDPQGATPELVTTTGAPTGAGPFTIPVPALSAAHSSGVIVSDFGTKTAGYDPLVKPASSYANRLRFTASAADTSVIKTTNTDAFRTLVAGTATESGLVTRFGQHLSGAASNPADLVAFVKRCIGVS